MSGFEAKRILITGAAKRLGAEMARHLHGQGHFIAIHYHQSENEALALAEELGARVALVQADLMDREALVSIVPRATQALGAPIDILINNASTITFDRVESASFAEWDQNFKTNLEAPFFLTQAFAAQCVGRGQVINMVDQKVLRVTPNYASYTLAKSALFTLTKTAAQALAPDIRVNAIGPGTTLKGTHQPEENFAHHRRISILERGADVEDILQALDYLLAADKVTGQMIAVDGGQHLVWKLPE